MKKVTLNARDINLLIGYVHTLHNLIDIDDIEDDETREEVYNGYDEFVVPIMRAVDKSK